MDEIDEQILDARERAEDPETFGQECHIQARREQIERSRDEDSYWKYYTAPDYDLEDINGKYLFFSKDFKLLTRIAIGAIRNHSFRLAKISRNPPRPGGEHVLCLYWLNDTRKYELAERYKDTPGLRYRYWKSDGDTWARKYSEEFRRKK